MEKIFSRITETRQKYFDKYVGYPVVDPESQQRFGEWYGPSVKDAMEYADKVTAWIYSDFTPMQGEEDED